mgnify:FL=1
MCLISQSLQPFVAKKDLKVFKILYKDKKGNYETPYQYCKVELNSLMQANENSTDYSKYNWGDKGHKCQLQIKGGFIHSLFRDIKEYGGNDEPCIVVAYIPEGTEYFINTRFMDVCSKQLRLTDEIVNIDDAILSKEEMMDILSPISETIDKEKVDAGWLVKSDKTFIHPSEYTNEVKDDIIGVVGSIIDGKIIVIALDETKCEWCQKNEKVDDMPTIPYREVYDNFKGKEYTEIIKNSKKYQEDNDYFPAFDYCLKYKTKGTESGDWYLPSTGELHRMLNMNRDVINYAFFIMGTTLIKDDTFYWASAECSSTSAWYCSVYGAFLYDWYDKWESFYVRPSFAIEAD